MCHYKSFYNLLSQTNVPSPIIHTGKHKVKKSRWKLINFWRKLTKTEVMEEIILYSWTIPKINDKDL